MRPPVLSVVDHDLCIGCGLCAALCADSILEMHFNIYGEYNPISIGECSKECGICLKACPFADSDENEDTIGKRLYGEIPEIQHRTETGYYLTRHVGFSEMHRQNSASGGMATWLMEALLKEGIVDHVICVAPTGDPDKLFRFQIFHNPQDVRSGAGSAYYPVEMSEVIRHVLNVPGRYAITGLPCFIKAIRLAQFRNKTLQKRIIITIGLVCGQMKSSHFTDYIAALAGIEGKVMSVHYRGKSPDQPASNFFFSFMASNSESREFFWKEGISEAWKNRWFTPNACNYCDDVFAECADVTFMDAWLPEYSKDSRGMNLMLLRSPLIQEVIIGGDGLVLNWISIEKIIQSQRAVLFTKRRQLAFRLYIANQEGLKVLTKRVFPKKIWNILLRQEVFIKERMRERSKENWCKYVPDIERFRETMKQDLERLVFYSKVDMIFSFPVRIIHYILRKVYGIANG